MWREILKAFNPLSDEDELEDIEEFYEFKLYNMLRESDFLKAVADLETEALRYFGINRLYTRNQLLDSIWMSVSGSNVFPKFSVYNNINPYQTDSLDKALRVIKSDAARQENYTDGIPFYYIYQTINAIKKYYGDIIITGQTHEYGAESNLPEYKPYPFSFTRLHTQVILGKQKLKDEIVILIRQYAADVGRELTSNFPSELANTIFKMVNVRDARDAAFIDNLEQLTDMWINFLEETHEEENDKRILDEIYSNARKGIFKHEIDEEIGVPYFAVAEHLVSLRKDDVEFQDEEDYQTRLEGTLNGIHSAFNILLMNKFPKESKTTTKNWLGSLYTMIYRGDDINWKHVLKAFDPLDDTLDDFDEVDEKELRTFVNESYRDLRKEYMVLLRNLISSSDALTFIKRIYNFDNDVIDDFTFSIIHGGYVSYASHITPSFVERFELPERLPDADKEYHFKMPFSRAFRNFNLFWNKIAGQLGLFDEGGFIELDNLRIDRHDWRILELEVNEELYKLMDKYSEDRKKIEQEIKDRESELK